jgi:hypothetical protein
MVVARNVGRDPASSLQARLEQIRAQIGSEAFDSALAANSDDMTVFETVRDRFEKEAAPQ